MSEKFIEAGYEITENIKEADICVINTCSVTNVSDRKSRQTLRKAKEKNSKTIIVVTGCYAQVSTKQIEQMPEVDLIIGNNEKKDIIQYIEKYIEQNEDKAINLLIQSSNNNLLEAKIELLYHHTNKYYQTKNKEIYIKINQLITEIENHPQFNSNYKKTLEKTILNLKQQQKIDRNIFEFEI